MSVQTLAQAAKNAALKLATAQTAAKNVVLASMANALETNTAKILAANSVDVERAREQGTALSLIDRLSLNSERLREMADGLRELRNLADPIGAVVRGWTLENGVKVQQVRVPMGVIGIIYEARPNVTADAAGICLKAGSAVLLRGSSSAVNSNRAIVSALRQGIREAKTQISEECIQLVEGGHESTTEMMQARGLIDVLIPRGGAGLIRAVVEGAKVPVIETGTGNCHLYIQKSADFAKARQILLNAKTQRPSVCNAIETLLIDREILADFLPLAAGDLLRAGVTLHCDEESFVLAKDLVCDVAVQVGGEVTTAQSATGEELQLGKVVPAELYEFDGEYLSLDLAVKTVADLDEAIAHIRAHSTGHSETIITEDLQMANRFTAEVDAAAVLVNTSSRFVDGGQFGFGAEIGISTQKMHARGPMALSEMTSTKYILTGDGQVRK